MAAPMKKLILAKSASFLLNILSKKHVIGSKVKYTLPLKYVAPTHAAKFGRSGIMSTAKQYIGNFQRPCLTWEAAQARPLGFFSQKKLTAANKHDSTNSRHYSNKPDKNMVPLMLMDFPTRIWPAPFKSFRNLFLSVLIRGYMDDQFRPDSFLAGAMQVKILNNLRILNSKFQLTAVTHGKCHKFKIYLSSCSL